MLNILHDRRILAVFSADVKERAEPVSRGYGAE